MTDDLLSDLDSWATASPDGEYVPVDVIAAAAAEIRRLRADLNAERAKSDCPSCRGSGRRWYALQGEMNCLECKGTGKRG